MKRLNGMDAILLYSEAPNVHTHTIKVAIVDNANGHLTLEVFREAVAQRMHRLEPLSYKLIDIPGRVHHPMWLQNCPVDLAYHIHAARVDGLGERADLDKTIGEIASTPLDRNYPLWEFYYTEGLKERKVALIGKIHHALADGVASANLLARLMDDVDAPLGHHSTPDTCTPPSSRELVGVAARDHLHQIVRLPSVLKQTVAGMWRLRRRARQRTQPAETASLLQAPETFINHVLSPTRTFASASLPLKVAKQTAKDLNVTLNDLILAVAAGALRTLVTRHDHRADHPLVASVPTSTESSPDRISGNELGGIQVSLPVHIDDPLERVRLTALATRQAKENQQLLGPALSGQLMDYLPPALAVPALQWLAEHDTNRRLMNVPISNVRGPHQFGYIAGARVAELYSVGPLTPGCGLNITVWSYVDDLTISVLADDLTVDDPREVTNAMFEAFSEIRCAYTI